MTLEQMLRFIEAKEAVKRSATQLFLPHVSEGGCSRRAITKEQDPCSYCGRKGHGKVPPLD